MPYQKQYYVLVERPTDHISSQWKAVHVLTFIIATICSFAAAYSLGRINAAFGDHCVLYAEISFATPNSDGITEIRPVTNRTTNGGDHTSSVEGGMQTIPQQSNATAQTTETAPNANKTVVQTFTRPARIIDLSETHWGLHPPCYFAQFTAVCSMIFAIVWGAFFIVLSKGGAGYHGDILNNPWKILYPFVIFTIIFIVVFSVSNMVAWSGLGDFCRNFYGTTDIGAFCPAIVNVYTSQFNVKEVNVQFFSYLAVVAGFLAVAAWVFQLVWSILRCICVIDFNFYIMTISQEVNVDNQSVSTDKVLNSHLQAEEQVVNYDSDGQSVTSV